MRHLLEREGLSDRVEVDSAGTAAYHTGEPPDRRSQAAARRRGVELGGRARAFRTQDWQRFDHVLAMDLENLDDLRRTAPNEQVLSKLRLLRSFDASAAPNAPVPDPYYGGEQGFDDVLDMCERACRGLIEHLRKEHGL